MKHWIQTYTGKAFDLENPRVEDICIEDIAHALSNLCRYTGHCKQFYSVAQHSVLCSLEAPDELKLAALMHDAAEAYVGDVSSPLKRLPGMGSYRALELCILQKIWEKFEIQEFEPGEPLDPRILEIDLRMLSTEVWEKNGLMVTPPRSWELTEPPYARGIIPGNPPESFWNFMYTFERLNKNQKGR